ncbi:MAG TPA: hypothetical protein VFG25_04635 [Nitrosopumilaceae archaeon]|nr:hypothetical protein [Nitrosopumilaceae archaeon]
MRRALQMLLLDRGNEFRELGASVFPTGSKPQTSIKNWEEYVLNFCFDVSEAFKCWSGNKQMEINSAMKALTILRQCSKNKKTMNQMTHLLNIAYNLAEEFKVIYRRIE